MCVLGISTSTSDSSSSTLRTVARLGAALTGAGLLTRSFLSTIVGLVVFTTGEGVYFLSLWQKMHGRQHRGKQQRRGNSHHHQFDFSFFTATGSAFAQTEDLAGLDLAGLDLAGPDDLATDFGTVYSISM